MSRTEDEMEDLPVDKPEGAPPGDGAKSEEKPKTAPESKVTETDISTLGEDIGEYEMEEGEYEGLEEEEEEAIVYCSEDLISGPFLSEDCTIEGNILEFDHSYGYDCKKYFNLVSPDPNTLVFLSGNIIHFFSVKTRLLNFRRSAFGGGLGHIQTNPNPDYHHIAIAECGINPPIIIYEWPSLEVVTLLKGGATRCFSHLDYSPDGALLVSQAGEPDYLITVWNWPRHRIMLRTKSYVNDVYKVKFSPYCPGQITTCGLAHIKFWKMAKTFTGLKLQGELGRFGKTEYSDIVGIYPMPDEKVVSGCFWGNMLVWDFGLIKLEVCRKLRQTCHTAPIVKMDFKDGELWTFGMDGWIKVWYYDTIDQADPPDDDRFVMIEPIYEFQVPGAQILHVMKVNDDPNNFLHYIQDGNGGLWRIDLTTETEVQTQPPIQLYKCHAGPVYDIATCSWGNYLASLGDDGRLFIYQYVLKERIFEHTFPARGRCIIWLPLSIEICGDELIMGFDDGCVRIMIAAIDDHTHKVKKCLLQVLKPHNRPVTAMTINRPGTLLITGGEDSTIFVFQLVPHRGATGLEPIGLIPAPDIVTCLTWHKTHDATIIVGCIHGQIMQVEVPTEPQNYTTITYKLHVEPVHQRFTTYKAQIRRDIKVAIIEKRKAEKLARKMVELEQVKKDNPGLEIDEEAFLEDSETEEVLEPLHIPEIPNRIFWIQNTNEDTLWLSMGGYDAGYIYEYRMDQEDEIPYKFQIIHDGDDIEMSSYVYNYNKKYFITAMQDGSLRVNKVNPDDFRDLKDYWKMSMHDNFNGYVPKMCFSYDERYFFSCGHDGNVFSYKFYPENNDYCMNYTGQIRIKMFHPPDSVKDVKDYSKLSLEEAKVKAEEDRIARVANEHKKKLMEKLKILRDRFSKLVVQNYKLQPTQIIPREELGIDPRITEHLKNRLSADLALVKRKLAYQVEKSEVAMNKLKKHFTDPLDYLPITVTNSKQTVGVKILRQRKLQREYFDMFKVIDQKLLEAEIKGRPIERAQVKKEPPPRWEKKEKPLEYFLMGLSPSTLQFRLNPQLRRLLNKYRARKLKWEKRQHEWDHFNFMKPEEGLNPEEDAAALKHAEETIGDYKLKSSPNYKVPREMRESTVKKYLQLMLIREKQYNIRHNFNEKVYKLRDEKVKLKEYLDNLTDDLNEIHTELPKVVHRFGPSVIEIEDSNFPEKYLEAVVIEKESSDTTLSEVVPIVMVPTGDMLEREVLLCEAKDEEINMENVFERIIDDVKIQTMSMATLDQLMIYAEDETGETPWETELRTFRLNKKLYEQDKIIKAMHVAIKEFDEKVQQLNYERFQVEVDADFIDLHLITLHQELIVLKEFESVEDSLQEKVNEKIIELMDVQDIVTDMNNKIDNHKLEIERLTEDEKAIQQQFFAAVTDNKFYDFLRRIFRKKYKPPKVRSADDSESSSDTSSSSEETEEEQEGSIDSRDFGIIRLDESVCPKGCDPTLYEMTFTLRSQRHVVEIGIKEEQKAIELLRKDVEINNKRIKIIETQWKRCQEELESFQREKQRKLNTVRCTTILRLQQFQHVLADKRRTVCIPDCLLFSRATLTKLYKRVGQLATETLQQKAKHKVNITHLFRMKNDIKYMNHRVRLIQEQIKELCIEKFGRVVDVDEVEEVLLKRMVMDLRLSLLDLKSMYEAEINMWSKRYGEKQQELLEILQENTSKLELLGLMNREKTELGKIVANQDKKKQHLEVIIEASSVYEKEIAHLSEIVKGQRQQLQQLKDEIKRLKTKGLPTEITKKPKVPVIKTEHYEEYDELFDWTEYDEYIEELRKWMDEMKKAKSTKKPSIAALPEKSEAVINDIIEEMLEGLNVELSKKSLENFFTSIIGLVLNRCSVAEIVDDLINNLPIEITDEKQSTIELAAEKIYSLQEPEVTESDIFMCAMETMVGIIELFMMASEHIDDALIQTIIALLEQLPLNFILHQESLDCIIVKFGDKLSRELDPRELVRKASMLHSPQAEDVQQILNEILERVYGEGMDYLYFIKN